MFARFMEWRRRRAARREKAKRLMAADPGDTLRQAQDNIWTGLATDARRNHPGPGSAPCGAGRR